MIRVYDGRTCQLVPFTGVWLIYKMREARAVDINANTTYVKHNITKTYFFFFYLFCSVHLMAGLSKSTSWWHLAPPQGFYVCVGGGGGANLINSCKLNLCKQVTQNVVGIGCNPYKPRVLFEGHMQKSADPDQTPRYVASD